MGYGSYMVGKRPAGYMIQAICEHPDCNEEIDRGMAYACGGEPFSEHGCDRYFCEKHKKFKEGKDVWLCERCCNEQEPFPYKTDATASQQKE